MQINMIIAAFFGLVGMLNVMIILFCLTTTLPYDLPMSAGFLQNTTFQPLCTTAVPSPGFHGISSSANILRCEPPIISEVGGAAVQHCYSKNHNTMMIGFVEKDPIDHPRCQ